MSRRVPAAFITATILFVTIFSMSIFANAASAFSPRLTAPEADNKYYYSNINIFYKYGYGMPNCTAYAYGRAYELLGTEPKLCPYDADEWYDYNKTNKYYSSGTSPKLGAIACWSYDGGGGHVAVVEKIENGKITFSNSAYSGTNFYLSTASTSDSNAGGSSWWNFQGYIYIGDFTSEGTTAATTAPAYKTGIYKTSVTTTLNMRSGAGTSYSYVTSIPNAVTLTVTNVQAGSDGYTWGYTAYNGNNGWVALDYCDYLSELPAETTAPPTTAEPTTQPETSAPATTVPPTTAPSTAPTGLGLGDVNCDGLINIDDATMMQKHIADMVSLSEEQITYADIDLDGEITILDVTGLQKYLSEYSD